MRHLPQTFERVELTAFQNMFLGFAGLVTAATAWMVFGQGDIFPQADDPKGDPQKWTEEEMRRWLRNVCITVSMSSFFFLSNYASVADYNAEEPYA